MGIMLAQPGPNVTPPRRPDAEELAGRAALCRSILQQRLGDHPDVIVAVMALDGATISEILAHEGA